jgi:hypothetical protein
MSICMGVSARNFHQYVALRQSIEDEVFRLLNDYNNKKNILNFKLLVPQPKCFPVHAGKFIISKTNAFWEFCTQNKT